MLTRKNRPSLAILFSLLLCLATAAAPAIAQDGHSPDQSPNHQHHGNHGRWWDNPHVADKVGITDAQRRHMNEIADRYRPRLKSLNSTLKKEEAKLHPLLQADNLNEHQVLHQIDTIAQARANLEKANARMLFGLRKVLTPEQWKKLQEMAREWHEHHRDHDHHGPDHGHPEPPPSH